LVLSKKLGRRGFNVQALFTNNQIVNFDLNIPTNLLPPSNSDAFIVQSNQIVTNAEKWETVVINFQTNSNAGQEFVSIGKIVNESFINNPLLQLSPIPVTCNWQHYEEVYDDIIFYLIDNVKLINTNQVDFTLPSSTCINDSPVNLFNQLSTSVIGTFSGSGVSGNIFSPSTAGLGLHTLTFTYTNSSNCQVVLPANIIVSECSSTSCPGNLVFDNTQPTTPANYQAAIDIVTNGNYIVNTGSTIDLKAGNSITIDTDSWIKNGSLFLAEIADCIQTSERLVQTTEEKQLEELNGNKIALYPNPTDSLVTILSTQSDIKSIIIVAIDGKIIFSKNNINQKEFLLNIDNYEEGLYIIAIETMDKTIIQRKIIKQ
jgi:hypothetical protein